MQSMIKSIIIFDIINNNSQELLTYIELYEN